MEGHLSKEGWLCSTSRGRLDAGQSGTPGKKTNHSTDFINVVESICSLLRSPYLELGTSRKLLRKLIAPNLGTAPRQTLHACVQLTYSGAYSYA